MPWLKCRIPLCDQPSSHHGLCTAHERARKAQVDATRGTTAQRGYSSRWRGLRSRVLASHPTCVMCHAPATDVHHLIARNDGGLDLPENLVPLCHEHHSSISARQGFARR